MALEQGQRGLAKDTKPGDWVLVRSRRRPPFFATVESLPRETKQPGNPAVKVDAFGKAGTPYDRLASIAGNTVVEKTGDFDY